MATKTLDEWKQIEAEGMAANDAKRAQIADLKNQQAAVTANDPQILAIDAQAADLQQQRTDLLASAKGLDSRSAEIIAIEDQATKLNSEIFGLQSQKTSIITASTDALQQQINTLRTDINQTDLNVVGPARAEVGRLTDLASGVDAYGNSLPAADSSTTTNVDKTAVASNEKMTNATVVAATEADVSTDTSIPSSPSDATQNTPEVSQGGRLGPSAAQKSVPGAGKVEFVETVTGKRQNKDLRVRIKVPDDYRVTSTNGPHKELDDLRGIIFPYTPSIDFEHKADYATTTPMHSNYAQYFYQHSSVSSITITGKFTVQNDTDANIYLATIHLLRTLTKMRYGGAGGDANSGAPPPVCRLDAYGDRMLNNVPVAITSFKMTLPDSIDYYTVDQKSSVPTVSTITVTCIPMYSRKEMQDFSVTGWFNNSPKMRNTGFL